LKLVVDRALTSSLPIASLDRNEILLSLTASYPSAFT